MGNEAVGVCRMQPFIDCRQLPFLHRDKILHGLLDDPGFRAIECARDRAYASIQAGVRAHTPRGPFCSCPGYPNT
jgi:hypothetical protein